jgi:hypothetical protein
MPLCAICENFDIQRLHTYLDEAISIRYSIVKENSELGCDLCSLISEAAQHHLDDFKAATIKQRGDADGPWIRISVDGEYKKELGKTVECQKLIVLICNYEYLGDDGITFDLSSTGEFYLAASQGQFLWYFPREGRLLTKENM